LNEKGLHCGYEKHLTSLQQMLRHVFSKQHRGYLIHSKSALLRNVVNKIENHIIEDITHFNKTPIMKKLQEKSNAQLLHLPLQTNHEFLGGKDSINIIKSFRERGIFIPMDMPRKCQYFHNKITNDKRRQCK